MPRNISFNTDTLRRPRAPGASHRSTLLGLIGMASPSLSIRPGVSNRNQWHGEERKRAVTDRIRKAILARDVNTCVGCGHRALKWMHIHHIQDGDDDDPANLCTLCAACHAVMHMGQTMQYGSIEIWKAPISQVDIIRRTRDGIRAGRSLPEISSSFGLKRGRRAPNSIAWANALLDEMGPEPRAELPEPLCAVFVNFSRWQIEA